jgi:hypothetical protein
MAQIHAAPPPQAAAGVFPTAGRCSMRDPATQTARATRPAAWSRIFPATAVQVPEARHFLAGILGNFLGADDALLCLSELVANAVLHSNSARPDGQFTIHATLRRACYASTSPTQADPGDNTATTTAAVGAVSSSWTPSRVLGG